MKMTGRDIAAPLLAGAPLEAARPGWNIKDLVERPTVQERPPPSRPRPMPDLRVRESWMVGLKDPGCVLFGNRYFNLYRLYNLAE